MINSRKVISFEDVRRRLREGEKIRNSSLAFGSEKIMLLEERIITRAFNSYISASICALSRNIKL